MLIGKSKLPNGTLSGILHTQQKNPSIKVLAKHWRGFLFTIACIFLLYGLSIGPAYRLREKSVIPIWFYQPIYLPIHVLEDRYKWFGQFITWYEDLWYAP